MKTEISERQKTIWRKASNKYYQKHHEKAKKMRQDYKLKNLEKVRKQDKNYAKRYYEKHKEQKITYELERQKRPDIKRKHNIRCSTRQKYKKEFCNRCGSKEKLTFHHPLPYRKDKFIILCRSCHGKIHQTRGVQIA